MGKGKLTYLSQLARFKRGPHTSKITSPWPVRRDLPASQERLTSWGELNIEASKCVREKQGQRPHGDKIPNQPKRAEGKWGGIRTHRCNITLVR